ncbi:MAG TPA: HlyD family efflux transporter periplasmic adaptor subunit [Pirellulales bacterium]|jgi:macrolide-specific efflux system membrane fusion protein
MSACFSLLLVLSGGVIGAEPASDPIEVEQALVSLIEQRAVPAREAGVLADVKVREGDLVTADQELARMDDTHPQLMKKKAQIELDIARVDAQSDVNIRFARKSTEVAKAELKRATDSTEKYKRSVSSTELGRLKLEAERAELQVEQAEQEQTSAKHTERLKENEVDFAAWNVDRMRVRSPLAGVVVEIAHHPGEWVEPGETVFRILRIDRLRVETFLDSTKITDSLVGRPVTLSLDLPGRPRAEFTGKVVFVSPEIDPVNGQARVWAEVENKGLALRPGLHGSLRIGPATDVAEAPKPGDVEESAAKPEAASQR